MRPPIAAPRRAAIDGPHLASPDWRRPRTRSNNKDPEMKISNELGDEAVLLEIGHRIAAQRVGRRMTQRQLASAAGVPVRSVERLEAGASLTLAVLIRCLRALDLLKCVDELLPRRPAAKFDVRQLRNGQQLSLAQPGAARESRPWSQKD